MRLEIRWIPALVVGLSLCATTLLRGEEAADFPPGLFTDNNRYSLNDLKGKVVVLFFFEETCPRCRGLIPERNKLVQSMRDKPVKFIAVDPGHPLADSVAYAQQTRFVMPVYADPMRIMEARWKQHISLNNIYQWKVIGPDGSVASNSEQDIPAIVATAKWKFKDKGYNAKLNNAIDAFEWNQYALGMKLLKPLLKDRTKAVAEDAFKLYSEIKTEGEGWKADAEKVAEEKPVEAYELYSRVSETFVGDELGKSVAEPLKKLKANKSVRDELAAQQMYAQLMNAMSKATPEQKGAVVGFCNSIVKKYGETPTGQKASALATELGAAS